MRWYDKHEREGTCFIRPHPMPGLQHPVLSLPHSLHLEYHPTVPFEKQVSALLVEGD